ncbi:MAG: LytTR family transcriptional regulator DNA-binding domain-containing protein [Microscillaceae bacterium]|nr:LytTR family transcriptional regulator DNA-binding domain-containing protein [Microscillaceae bacterium]
MFAFLFHYYPIDIRLRYKLYYALGAGIFVALFLIYFQPFSSPIYQFPNGIWILAGVGVVVSMVLYLSETIFPFLFPQFFSIENWRVIHQIVFSLLLLLLICVGLTLYFLTIGMMPAFGGIVRYVFSIGAFPTFLYVLIDESLLLKQKLNAQNLSQINPKENASVKQLLLEGTGNKEKLCLQASQLLYAASSGSYVQVFWLKEDVMQNTLLRQTIKNIEFQGSDFPEIKKCHRGYIVNLYQVQEVKGNANGLLLSLKNTKQKIPVSRQFVKEIQERLAILGK